MKTTQAQLAELSTAERQFLADIAPHWSSISQAYNYYLALLEDVSSGLLSKRITDIRKALRKRAAVSGPKVNHFSNGSGDLIYRSTLRLVGVSISLGVKWAPYRDCCLGLYADVLLDRPEDSAGLYQLIERHADEALTLQYEGREVSVSIELDPEDVKHLPEHMEALLVRWLEAVAQALDDLRQTQDEGAEDLVLS
jgi:hypothetical protein